VVALAWVGCIVAEAVACGGTRLSGILVAVAWMGSDIVVEAICCGSMVAVVEAICCDSGVGDAIAFVGSGRRLGNIVEVVGAVDVAWMGGGIVVEAVCCGDMVAWLLLWKLLLLLLLGWVAALLWKLFVVAA
jgi:hypothetical protein